MLGELDDRGGLVVVTSCTGVVSTCGRFGSGRFRMDWLEDGFGLECHQVLEYGVFGHPSTVGKELVDVVFTQMGRQETGDGETETVFTQRDEQLREANRDIRDVDS